MTEQYTPRGHEMENAWIQYRLHTKGSGGDTTEYSREYDRHMRQACALGYDYALNTVASRGLISIEDHDELNQLNPYRRTDDR